jgi:cell division protein FtsN
MARPDNLRPSATAARARASRRSGAGGTLLGVFIGLVLGLGLAAGVAYYLMKSNGPFPAQGGAKDARESAREPAKVAKSDKADAGAEKPRFDFYKILPGSEEPKVQPEAKKSPDRAAVGEAKDRGAEKAPDAAAEKPAAKPAEKVASADAGASAKPAERFWLQAGSFATEADAENLKARLAFAGWQANVQQGTLPDKGVRYRVRLGPYDNTDELNRIRSDLAKNGFDVAVIKF